MDADRTTRLDLEPNLSPNLGADTRSGLGVDLDRSRGLGLDASFHPLSDDKTIENYR